MKTALELELNSGLFNVTPPCGYWVFDGFFEDVERSEREACDKRMEETVKVWDGGGQLFLTGKPAYRIVRRGGLPKDHPDYAGKVRCTLDHAKALDILAGLWLGVFRDRIAGCYKERGREVDAVCAFRGTWSPKEYNWSHDACDFTLTITREGMDRIIAWALDENRKAFGAYVRRYYRSYDGFISYLPDYVWGYDELREKDRGGSGADGVKHLYWACLNFFLFPDEDAEQWFDDCLCNALWDRYSVFVEEAVIYEEDEEGGEEEAL